jgi:hypothetical protein
MWDIAFVNFNDEYQHNCSLTQLYCMNNLTEHISYMFRLTWMSSSDFDLKEIKCVINDVLKWRDLVVLHWAFNILKYKITAKRDMYNETWIYVCIYTGCPRRNVPDLGRVFLMLKYTDITQNTYTDITQNTYIQSWTVTEIMAREVWNFDSCYTLID